jgi:hypothetical protein
VTRVLRVGLTYVPVKYYPELREFFQQVHSGDAEGVVFVEKPG